MLLACVFSYERLCYAFIFSLSTVFLPGTQHFAISLSATASLTVTALVPIGAAADYSRIVAEIATLRRRFSWFPPTKFALLRHLLVFPPVNSAAKLHYTAHLTATWFECCFTQHSARLFLRF
jgi:hypothetical protein